MIAVPSPVRRLDRRGICRAAFDDDHVVNRRQRVQDDRQPLGGSHGAHRIGGAHWNHMAFRVVVGMDHVGELRFGVQEVGDAGEIDALQHRARRCARCRHIEQQHAQAGIGDFPCHEHGRGGAFITFGRDEDGPRRPAEMIFSTARLMPISPSEGGGLLRHGSDSRCFRCTATGVSVSIELDPAAVTRRVLGVCRHGSAGKRPLSSMLEAADAAAGSGTEATGSIAHRRRPAASHGRKTAPASKVTIAMISSDPMKAAPTIGSIFGK